MPDNSEQQLQKFNKLSDELKKEQIKKNQESQMKMKQEIEIEKQKAIAKERDELAKEGIAERSKHGTASHWDMVDRHTKRSGSEGMQTYIDWRACMMDLLVLSKLVFKALTHSRNEFYLFMREDATDTLKEKFKKELSKYEKGRMLLGVPDAIEEAIRKEAELKLPALRYNVGCADDGTIDIAPLQLENSDAVMNQEINKLFREGIYLWLEENGYTEHPDEPGKFVSNNGAMLTQQDFQDLVDDEVNGLASFLSRQPGGVDFQPTSPSPR